MLSLRWNGIFCVRLSSGFAALTSRRVADSQTQISALPNGEVDVAVLVEVHLDDGERGTVIPVEADRGDILGGLMLASPDPGRLWPSGRCRLHLNGLSRCCRR